MRAAAVTSGLAGKRVLIARAGGQTAEPARLLRERGAEPVIIPSIVIGSPDDPAPLLHATTRFADFDWIVFTSANGVDLTWVALGWLPPDDLRAAVTAARFAVVGKATREALEKHGAVASLEATESRAEGLIEPLLAATKGRGRVLLLRAQEGNDALPTALVAAGLEVEVVAAYRTRPSPTGTAEIRDRLLAGTLDVVVFSSGSTVDAICDALGDLEPLKGVTIACIGPVTEAAAVARGLRVDVVPRVTTFAAVIEALEERFPAI